MEEWIKSRLALNHRELAKRKKILEKNWKDFRLSTGLEYEPMSDKAYEFIENAMEEYAELRLANVSISLPKQNSGEMRAFLLVNALKCLNEEQRAGLCFNLYSRNELTESIDECIRKLVVISRLKSNLDRWIENCEIAKGKMNEIGHHNDAEHYEAQKIAYNEVKDFLEQNGL